MSLFKHTGNQSDSRPHFLSFGTTPNASNSQAVQHAFLHASIKIAGVVFLIALFLLLLATQRVSSSKRPSAELNNTHNSGVNLKLNTATASQPSAEPDSSSSTSFSTGQSSPASNGGSLKVTVNGQDVPVPDNGTVNGSVTSPDGSNSTNISINTSNAGDSSNTSFTSTNMNLWTGSTATSFDNTSTFTYGGGTSN